MKGGRLVLWGAAVALSQILVFSRLEWRGASPLPAPVFVLWTGLALGAVRGAGTGLLTGALLWLLGGSPWEMGVLSLMGGVAGVGFPDADGFWGRGLFCLPLLAGWETLKLLGLWLAGGDALAALPPLGREWLLCAATVPLVGALFRFSPRNR